MPTVIELERPAQLPTTHRYWVIRADTWDAARAQACPQVGSFVFGHLGDGNLHVCLAVTPEEATPEALAERLSSQIDFWGPVIQRAGVYAN